jgi:DNA-binding IclR family transcriptional regulator
MRLSTIEKGIQLIELLSRSPKGLALVDISKGLGFPNSSVHHILQTFLAYDFVSQEPETKKYALGLKFLQISSKMLENFDIREIAKKYLIQLNEKSHEIVQLYILRKGKLICIDKIGSPVGGLSISSFVGWTTEPHPAAAGKVLLSELSTKEIMDIYPDKSMRVYGKNTITDFDALLKELQLVREQGYAIDDEEYYEGVRCVSAPIRAGGKIVASVSITGSIFSMTMKRISQGLISLVTMTGEKVSNELINIHL